MSKYVFPLPKGVGFSWARTDMGVDIESKHGASILAIGDAIVLRVQAMGAFGPTFVTYKLTSGPYKGRTVFVGHSRAVVKPGQRVAAGEPVATVAGLGTSMPGHLEIGWANGDGSNTLAAPHYKEGQVTAEGSSFRGFLDSLTSKVDPIKGAASVPAAGASSGSGSGGSDPLTPAGLVGAVFDAAGKEALKALLYVVLVLGGIGLAAMGALHAAGVKPKQLHPEGAPA